MVALTHTPLKLKPELSSLKTGVYCIRNKVNGKVYVGSGALSISSRINHHKMTLRKKTHHNRRLQREWDLFGPDAFDFLTIATCAPEWCVILEQIYLNKYDSCNPEKGYNMCPIAGNCLGRKHGEEAKSKFREIAKKRILSTESREKIRNTLKAMWADPEYKKAMSKKMRAGITADGIKRGADKKRGRPLSEEAKEKISMAHKNMPSEVRLKIDEARWAGDARERHAAQRRGKKHTVEQRAKISAGLTGHQVSESTREKIAEKTSGSWRNPAFRANVISKLVGHPVSAETRAKLSAAHKGRPAHNKGIPLSDEHRKKLKEAWVIRRTRKDSNVPS